MWLTWFFQKAFEKCLIRSFYGNFAPCREREDPCMGKCLEDRSKWSIFTVEGSDRWGSVWSMLEPFLFNMAINYFKKHASSEIIKFDDINLFRVVKLGDWAIKWQLKFSVDKCSVMYIKRRNTNFTFMSCLEWELGVMINSHTETSVFSSVQKSKSNIRSH